MKMKMAEDKLLLNYHDACIYSSDISLLEHSSSWLNDACVNFQMTRLQQKEKKSNGSSDILFLDPCVISYLMHQCQSDGEIIDLSTNLQLLNKKMLFIPINDNNGESFQTTTIGNGNHWSLLLVILSDTVYYLHFDSSKRYNCAAARSVSKKISYLLMLSNYEGDAEIVNVIECHTPQQKNGHDCGIYLLTLAEMLSSSEEIRQKIVLSEEIIVIKELVKCCERVIEGADADFNFGVHARKRIATDVRSLISHKNKSRCP